jgi:hypothetical protein
MMRVFSEPFSPLVATGKCASQGVLTKSGNVLGKAHKVKEAIFFSLRAAFMMHPSGDGLHKFEQISATIFLRF